MGVSREALQLHAVNTNPYLYYKSHENPYRVLQVMYTAFGAKVYQNEYHSSVAVGIVTHAARNNTDGNELVAFSIIALYYDEAYE